MKNVSSKPTVCALKEIAMNSIRSLKVRFFGIVVVLFSPALMFGQSEKGSIVGVVTDVNGGRVTGATVTITNLETKKEQTFTTNSEGIYDAP